LDFADTKMLRNPKRRRCRRTPNFARAIHKEFFQQPARATFVHSGSSKPRQAIVAQAAERRNVHSWQDAKELQAPEERNVFSEAMYISLLRSFSGWVEKEFHKHFIPTG
jgi:hypothetical protein